MIPDGLGPIVGLGFALLGILFWIVGLLFLDWLTERFGLED